MKVRMVGVLAGLLACLAAGSVYAAYDQAVGEIKSVDVAGGKLVLAARMSRDEQPKDITYLINSDTSVRFGREIKTLADLTAGMRAGVFFKVAEGADATPTALLITVLPPRREGAGGRPGAEGSGVR